MHPQGVDLNLFGSVCPECRGEERSKGEGSLRRASPLVVSSRRLVVSSSRLVVSSSRRFVVSFRRLASFRFRFVGRGGGGGKKGGTQDKLNQRGSKRPLEDAL